ncbi:hypothetical protein CPB86DRAFT_633509 [Serendipita vermifera]|nr:hypothetical protein CPB86DRAFT_633509 [Serendipita vermifera]
MSAHFASWTVMRLAPASLVSHVVYSILVPRRPRSQLIPLYFTVGDISQSPCHGRKRGIHREGELAQVHPSESSIASHPDSLSTTEDAIIAPFSPLGLVSCFSWLMRQICEMLAKSEREPRRNRWLLCNAMI